jgi:hypothetical protein
VRGRQLSWNVAVALAWTGSVAAHSLSLPHALARARSISAGMPRPPLPPPGWRRKQGALDTHGAMTVVRSILLFVLAVFAEIGGAWLVWQGRASILACSSSVPGSSRSRPTGCGDLPV